MNPYIQEALKKGNWKIEASRKLRYIEKYRNYCPLTYAYFLKTNKYVPVSDFMHGFVYSELDLSEKDAMNIMRAADGILYADDLVVKDLRNEMLKIIKQKTLWGKFASLFRFI